MIEPMRLQKTWSKEKLSHTLNGLKNQRGPKDTAFKLKQSKIYFLSLLNLNMLLKVTLL